MSKIKPYIPSILYILLGVHFYALAFGAKNFSFSFLKFKYTAELIESIQKGSFSFYLLIGVGTSIIYFGLYLGISKFREEKKSNELINENENNNLFIIIESRSLTKIRGKTLLNSLPKSMKGKKEQVIIDLRQNNTKEKIIDPESALIELQSSIREVNSRQKDLHRDDITIIYGGLLSVPYNFLAGVLLEDEGSILLYDWDRHNQKWMQLDRKDDYERFEIKGLESIEQNITEVVVSISISYKVDDATVQRLFVQYPFVKMYLNSINPDNLCSEEKQVELGKQFLNVMNALSNKGVKTIHLLLAGQNSVVFRFGRLYDTRNLPNLIIYQFERGEENPYPWGIVIPARGTKLPYIKSMNHSSIFIDNTINTNNRNF